MKNVVTTNYTNLAEMETYGQEMAIHRSIDMAIKVFTDAETDTPCIYDTVLQMKVPSVHSVTSVRIPIAEWCVFDVWKMTIRLGRKRRVDGNWWRQWWNWKKKWQFNERQKNRARQKNEWRSRRFSLLYRDDFPFVSKFEFQGQILIFFGIRL